MRPGGGGNGMDAHRLTGADSGDGGFLTAKSFPFFSLLFLILILLLGQLHSYLVLVESSFRLCFRDNGV